MTNRVDSDETAHDEPSHKDLHCLQKYLSWYTGLAGLTHKQTCPYLPYFDNRAGPFYTLFMCIKCAWWVANSQGQYLMFCSNWSRYILFAISYQWESGLGYQKLIIIKNLALYSVIDKAIFTKIRIILDSEGLIVKFYIAKISNH